MSTLAHEGNPKENSIVIAAGDVLSTAQLDIDFQFFGSQGPNIPPPAEALTLSSYTCSDVFDWPGKEEGQDWIYFSDSPCQTTNGSRTRWADPTLQLRINSTPACYGVLWQKISPVAYPTSNPASGARIDWRTSFNGVIDGTPRSGPCVWITDATTHAVASLYAAIYNADLGVIQLCSWANASLASIDNATILGTISLAPVVGDIFWLTMAQRPEDVGVNEVAIDLRSSDLATSKGSASFVFEDTTQQAIFNQSRVRHNRCGVGFVSVGGVTAGKLEFKHSADQSCQNGLTPWIDVDSSGGT